MDINGYNIICGDHLPQKPCPMMGNNSCTMSKQGTTVELLTHHRKRAEKPVTLALPGYSIENNYGPLADSEVETCRTTFRVYWF